MPPPDATLCSNTAQVSRVGPLQWCLLLALTTCTTACLGGEGTSTAPGEEKVPNLVIREYPNGCPVEVIESSSEDTDTVLVTFDGLVNENCAPKLAQWGIDLADPIGVDTPQGNQLYQINRSNMANLPLSPSGAGLPNNAVRVVNGSPPQVMIEFDPPVSSAEFYYSFPFGGRAYWNGQIEDPTDSMMVYAMSRTPGTLSYTTWASKKLYANNPALVPPAVWSIWSAVKLATSQDRIQWLWFNGVASIDHLKITRTPLRCTPSTVMTGQTVSCEVSGNYEVSKWEFYMDDGDQSTGAMAQRTAGEEMALTSLEQTPTIEWVSNSKTWAGPVGIGGTVRAHVVDQTGNPRILASQFGVTYPPSPWKLSWRYRRGDTPPIILTVPDHDPEPWTTGSDTMGRNCPEQSCLLRHRRLQPDPVDSASRTFTPLHVTLGPNKELWFVYAVHYNMHRVANVNPGILPTSIHLNTFTLPPTTPKKCRQGLGVSPKATTATANWWRFNDACGTAALTGRDMTDWVNGVWAHEEFGRNGGQGHESLARTEADKPENDPYVAIRDLWAWDSLGLAGLADVEAFPINTRITEATRDPKPFGNLAVTGQWIWYWRPSTSSWVLVELNPNGPDL